MPKNLKTKLNQKKEVKMPKVLKGEVVSTKMEKTAVVAVERKTKHPVYKKTLKVTKKYKAHVEDVKVKEGDIVKIKEIRPMSKDKHFKMIEVLEK